MRKDGSWSVVALVIMVLLIVGQATNGTDVRATDRQSTREYAMYLPLVGNSYCAWCSTPILLAPADGSTLNTLLPVFKWDSGQDPRAIRGTLEVATDPGFTCIYISDGCDLWARGLVERLDWMRQLRPATTYWWRARLECQEGAGPYSDVWSFTTAAEGVVPAAPALRAPTNGSTLLSLPATLQWWAVDGAVGYRVLWQKLGGSSVESEWVSDTQITLDGLEAGAGYEWWVLARSDYAFGARSAIWQFAAP